MPRIERQLAKQRQEVRSLGLKKLIVGGAASVLMLLWLMSGKPSASGGAFKLILFALPLVVAMMGFLETSSGVPFSRFSEAWDELQGWQRGVLGVAIFVVAVVVIMGGKNSKGFVHDGFHTDSRDLCCLRIIYTQQ